MFSDRPSRVHGRAVLHTEGEKGAVRVQKEAPVHTEGEEKEAAGKGSFLEMF